VIASSDRMILTTIECNSHCVLQEELGQGGNAGFNVAKLQGF